MNGRLVTYLSFTQSDKVHLIIKVSGHRNYIGNNVKINDKIELKHKCTTP